MGFGTFEKGGRGVAISRGKTATSPGDIFDKIQRSPGFEQFVDSATEKLSEIIFAKLDVALDSYLTDLKSGVNPKEVVIDTPAVSETTPEEVVESENSEVAEFGSSSKSKSKSKK